jgi:hypothetical protein
MNHRPSNFCTGFEQQNHHFWMTLRTSNCEGRIMLLDAMKNLDEQSNSHDPVLPLLHQLRAGESPLPHGLLYKPHGVEL